MVLGIEDHLTRLFWIRMNLNEKPIGANCHGAKLLQKATLLVGGDGGGSNSPSKKGGPEFTTGIVNSLISPGQPLLTEFDQANR